MKLKVKQPNITNLTTNYFLNAIINKVKSEILNITNLATASALTAVENKIPDVSDLVQKSDYNTRINEVKKKISDHDHNNKYITTPEFKKLTPEGFAERLKQANLASKSDIVSFLNQTDFDNQVKNVTSSKNELSELSKKVLIKQSQKKDYQKI